MTNYEKWKAEQPAIERLLEEIQRLAKVYAGNQIALEFYKIFKIGQSKKQ